MEVIKETLWKRCLSTPTKPLAKNSNKFLSETAYQHKGTRKKCKKTNQAAISQWQRQCLMYKPHRKPRPKSKTSDISRQSPSPLHHTFLLGRVRFTAQPLSTLWLTERTYASTDCTGRVGRLSKGREGCLRRVLASPHLLHMSHNMVNWQLSKQNSHWPVSHDHIAGSCVNSSRWRDLIGGCLLTS